MSNYLTTDTDLIAVADAIRAKGGTSSSLSFPGGYVSAIQDIQTGGNLESITIKPENCMSSSTQITPETYICETDSSYPGTVISMNGGNQKNIGQWLNGSIKIELNKTYHCNGQLFIKWNDDDTEEYYYINSNFRITSYTTVVPLNFTWEGSSGAVKTFDTIYINLAQEPYGYQTIIKMTRTGGITNSGILLSGSFYRITQVDNNDGYDTINLDFDSNPRFYGIYRSLTYRSSIASSASRVSEWCNSLSRIDSFQFAGQSLYGDFIFSNVSIVGQYAFAWNYNGGFTGTATAYNLTFPILPSLYDNAPFAMNRGLKSIYCPSVTTIGGSTFYNCSSLTSAIFPECTTINSYAFYSCGSLTTISFPECTSIGGNAFQACKSLTAASFPECTSIGGYAFYNCIKLATISFPKCTTIGGYAFYSCSKLTTASFPECTTIGLSAFINCYSLTTISFSQCTSIQAGAFSSCSALTIAYFPECIDISNYAFCNCISLTTASFPKCTFIGGYAFSNCQKLASLYFMGSSIPSLSSSNAFNSTPIKVSTYLGYYGSIYVPSSLLADYKTATNWATYSARMVGI